MGFMRADEGIEACFPTDAVLPAHWHENGFFRLILAGIGTDICGGKKVVGEAPSMVYHPAAESHANLWHRNGRGRSGDGLCGPKSSLRSLQAIHRHDAHIGKSPAGAKFFLKRDSSARHLAGIPPRCTGR
jgi:hypothetical protein